jgi:hypothetical protein
MYRKSYDGSNKGTVKLDDIGITKKQSHDGVPADFARPPAGLWHVECEV